MNAYELADELAIFAVELSCEISGKSANMLRQQADRIAELEKIVKNTIGQAFYEDDFHKAEATIARQIETVDKFAEENAMLCNRIAELEKFTKAILKKGGYPYEQSEPVAWMLVDEINGDYMLERYPSGDYDWTPLYTTPHHASDVKQTKPFPWSDVSNEKLIDEVRNRGYKIKNAEIQTKLSDEEKLQIIRTWRTAKGMREQDLIGLCDAIEAKVRGQ